MKREKGVLGASDRGVLRDPALLVVILLIATFFRTHLFEAAPPGLQHEEIFKANFALDILDGGWPVFFDANGGEEALFPYLTSLSILLFGRSFFALRFVSLACGILTVALSYSLTRQLFVRRVALLATAALAISFWHVFDIRVALRPITLLMMALASFNAFWLGLRRGGVLPFALSGLFLGGSFYTYTSGFLIPLTIVLFVLFYLLPFRRSLLRQRWRGILLALVVALIVFLPMGYHMYSHPVTSTARARDLSDHINLFLEGQPGPLLKDALNVVGMFGLRGDPEWRYNLAGRPVFDLLTFALFCGGLVICLRRMGKPGYAFILVWLCVNIVPSATTRQSPSTLRAIGSLTPIYIMPALTIDASWDLVRRRFGSRGTQALAAAVALLLAFNALWTYRDYFTVWARNSEVRDIYRADLSAEARFLEESVGDDVVCVSASFAADLDQQVLNFMLGEQLPIRWFDGQQALVFPEADPSQDVLYVFPATGPLREDLASRFFSELPVAEAVLDPRGEAAFVAYRLGPGEWSQLRVLQPSHPLSVHLEERMELLGYELPPTVEAGGDLSVFLFWRVSQPIRPDILHTFFAHLVDTRGYVWVQVDTLGYPASSWIEGDVVIQAFDFTVPPDAPPLQYPVKLGMYDTVTGERLSATAQGAPLPEGVVTTDPVSVAKAAIPPGPEELDIPRERNADLGGKVILLGCDLGPRVVEKGESVHVSLFWQALAKPELDYMVSVLLSHETGEDVQEILREPVDGEYPTSAWSEGEVVRDRFDLSVDEPLLDGRYRLWVGLYDPESKSYLQLTDAAAERVPIGKVRVVSEGGG